ncbi:hypothetical protein ACSBR2_008387 [Camellia fascicularis]
MCQVQDRAIGSLATYGKAADNAATPDSGMGPLSGGTLPRNVPNHFDENVVDCSLFDDALPRSTVDGSTNAKR